MKLKPGIRLGVYEILTLLGSGGMGEVWRARDCRLGRDVAIKVLSDAFAADPDRLARFELEARVLASLNHPHIAAIHGVEESGGLTALVLELIDGEPLSDRLRRGRLSIREALDVARQIADALDAAHERGIVHRDLKPANIAMTPDGTVKVLDFGLARSTAVEHAADSLTHSPTVIGPTGAGVLLGTAPYMSPEQARGKVVDKRTDIWAFGCVLYEMLTGRQAFGGDTVSDTVAAILERDPDWSRLPPSMPAGLARTLRDCLAKNPKQRLRDIGDVRLDREAEGAPNRSGRGRMLVAAAAAAAAAGAAAVVFAVMRSQVPPSTTPAAIERLTFDAARVVGAAISADGRLLAFGSDRAGRGDLDIWVQQTVGGSPIRITDDQADDIEPDFSPDGSEIAFRSDRGSGGVYVTSSLGSRPARLVVVGGRSPRFSPDGRWIAYWTGQFRGDPSGTVSSLFVVPTEGGAPVQLAKDFYVARNPAWAPDSRSVAFVGRHDRAAPLAEALDIWRVPIDGAAPARTGALDLDQWRSDLARERLTIGRWTPRGLLIADGGSIFSLRLGAASGGVEGRPELLAQGAGTYRTPVASTKGDIVFADPTAARVIERATLAGIDAATAPPTQLYADGDAIPGRVSQTADGGRIVFERPSGHRAEVWTANVPGGEQQMVVSVETAAQVFPSVSPNGSRIGYTVPVDQRRSVTVNGRAFVIDTSAGVPQRLCDDCGFYEFLSDDKRAVVAAGDTEIRVIDAVSHEEHTVVRAGSERVERPSVSPNDRIIAWRRTTGTVAKVLVAAMPATGLVPQPSEVDEPTTTGRPAGWSADSRTLYLLLDTDGHRCVWGQHVDERGQLMGKPFAARHFHDFRGANTISTSLGNAVSPAGFTYETTRVSGDLWRLVFPGPVR